ncbi:hypothetical protein K440DRAFT_661863 [Wilcoxina mikolae CBS 423.85]|nr:hypothetical protein K440DRAFT_661863 [Wilcoxina mikolae CBS 423.85]
MDNPHMQRTVEVRTGDVAASDQPVQRTARTGDTTYECALCNKKNEKFGIFESEHVDVKGCTKCTGMLFCKSHWERFPSHDPDWVAEEERRVHRKLDPYEYRPIRALLSSASEVCADTLTTYHTNDTIATWFGLDQDRNTDNDEERTNDHNNNFHKKREEEKAGNSGLGELAKGPALTWVQTKRFADILSTEKELNDEQFPRLVSFVGPTGVGKSFLIKSLMTLHGGDEKSALMPIPAALKSAGTATSYNVHMEQQSRNIPYQLRSLLVGAETTTLKSDNPHVTRETYVDEIYPRILYSLSDVICFVTNTPNNPEMIFKKLIFWADEAVSAAINQTALPYAIMVLNCPKHHNPDLVEPEKCTEKVLGLKETMVLHDPKLQKIATKWNLKLESGGITTISDLLKCYFRDVRVIYVSQGHETSIGIDVFKSQLEKLRDCIQMASIEGNRNKYDNFRLLTARQFDYVSDAALRHFSDYPHVPIDKRRPFNILKTVEKNERLPQGFTGHVINLMEKLDKCITKTTKKHESKLPYALLRKSKQGKSVEMAANEPEPDLDMVVSNVLGSTFLLYPNANFQPMLDNCKIAYEAFYDKDRPCGAVGCVNVQKGHAKGHQKSTGEVISPGAQFVSAFSVGSQQRFIKRIEEKLQDCRATSDDSESRVLRHMQNLREQHAYMRNVKSKKTCFTCLMEVPQHCMPCGHTICETCVRRYGVIDPQDIYTVSFKMCPLGCTVDNEGNNPAPGVSDSLWWSIQLKPPTAGVRILALDGGGVRGVVTSGILVRLEEELDLGLPIHRFFDLIVGTSAGGILALALGHSSLTSAEAHKLFSGLSKDVFKKGFWKNSFAIAQALRKDAVYPSGLIEIQLQKAFTKNTDLFGSVGPRIHTKGQTSHVRSSLKVGVAAATTGGRICIMSNYIRKVQSNAIDFYREEDPEKEVKVWQAGRCTSAAPYYFNMSCAPNGTMYQDGGIRANCPAQIAFRERQFIWPGLDSMDCLTSVGTGFTQEEIPPMARWYWRLSNSLYSRALDAQVQWEEAIGEFETQYPGKVHRHNPKLDKNIGLDDVSKIEELQLLTNSYYSHRDNRETLRSTAMSLISSLFYFEVHQINKTPSHWVDISGQISCRLHYLEEDARKRLQQKIEKREGSFFDKSDSGHVRRFECHPDRHRDLVCNVSFTALNPEQEISLELKFSGGEVERALISGMPQMVKNVMERSMNLPRVVKVATYGSSGFMSPGTPAHNDSDGLLILLTPVTSFRLLLTPSNVFDDPTSVIPHLFMLLVGFSSNRSPPTPNPGFYELA